jgi:hypothetical protein
VYKSTCPTCTYDVYSISKPGYHGTKVGYPTSLYHVLQSNRFVCPYFQHHKIYHHRRLRKSTIIFGGSERTQSSSTQEERRRSSLQWKMGNAQSLGCCETSSDQMHLMPCEMHHESRCVRTQELRILCLLRRTPRVRFRNLVLKNSESAFQ